MSIHGECVLDLFCIVKDAGGRANKQEHMGELGVNCGDEIVVHL